MSVDGASTVRRLPGVQGLWVFLGFDATIFLLLFGSFLSARHAAPALFEASRLTLDRTLGGLDTLILLTSSWLVALAVQARDPAVRRRFLLGGWLTGLLFVASKAVEYTDRIVVGVPPGTGSFFLWYFVLTGVHLLHVIGGTVALVLVWRARPRQVVVESVASFWHLVDLLWIVIFPLLYLLR